MGRKHEETLDLVREAIDQIKRGDITDALTTLERTAFPKWQSPDQARLAYAENALGRPLAGHIAVA